MKKYLNFGKKSNIKKLLYKSKIRLRFFWSSRVEMLQQTKIIEQELFIKIQIEIKKYFRRYI